MAPRTRAHSLLLLSIVCSALLGYVTCARPAAAASAAGPSPLDVRDYGAKGDGATLDTAPILKALADAYKGLGGGAVAFPAPGVYLTGPLNVTGDGITLVVESNARIEFSAQRA